MTAADELREAAEYPNAFIELGSGQERIATDRFSLCLEPSLTSATVQRQRFAADEIDGVLEEVRGLLRERGRRRTQWEIGTSATPPGLAEALLTRGLERDDEPFAVALVLDHVPPKGPPDLIARRVTDPDEYVAGVRVQEIAFGGNGEVDRERVIDTWRRTSRTMHIVLDGGQIIAAGGCVPTAYGLALFGGAVLPAARGRGAYRALVAARWADAQSRGLGALLTQAGAMSRPVLTRLGFEAVGRVDMLVDAF